MSCAFSWLTSESADVAAALASRLRSTLVPVLPVSASVEPREVMESAEVRRVYMGIEV